MTVGGKLFWLAITAGGFATALWSFWYWSSADFGLFLTYVTLAGAAACGRLKIRGVTPVLSLHFLFVLLSVSQLSLPETMVIALAGGVLQYLLFAKEMAWREFLFELGTACLATTGTYLFYVSVRQPSPLALVASTSILFLLTTLPPCIMTRLNGGPSVLQAWKDGCLRAFPPYLAGGSAAGLLSLINKGGGWDVGLLILPTVYWMYVSYRQYETNISEDRRQIRELAGLNYRTIETLGLTMESHDPHKTGHVRRMSIYVSEIGRRMGLSEKELQALHVAALLHDIGKLAVPEHILTKPGELTEAEFESLKIHPVAGAEILEQVRFPYPVAPIVRAHREKWDGTGYPAGLAGEEIPIGARILGVVDCLDALVSSRYHRGPISIDRAVDFIRAESGKSFDPQVVQVLVLLYRDLELLVDEARRLGLQTTSVLGDTPDSMADKALSRGLADSFLNRVAAARREEQNLFLLLRELGNSLSLDETLAVCAQRIHAMCPYDAILISIEREQNLSVAYSAGIEFRNSGPKRSIAAGSLSKQVAANCQAIVNADPAAELVPIGGIPAEDLHSALVAPLEGPDGLVGVVALFSRARHAYTTDHLRVLHSVSTKAALSVENAIKYSQAQRSASTDVLTGLPNARSLFIRLDGELARARREHHAVTVLVCDLDRFKQVNDGLGHLEGNRVLKLVADALASQCREYDFVARMGGDEFVVVLSAYPSELLEAKIQQFQLAVDVACRQTPNGFTLGLSVGQAIFPDDGEDAESLLAAADRNMYRMKLLRKHPTVEVGSHDLQKLRVTLGEPVR